MGKNLISVLLPVYNAENTIKDCITSLLNQTYSNIEIIIVNDASFDNSEEIILSYKDNRIKYFKNDINRGISDTLNFAISQSNGYYLARMDSDDIALEHRFENQLKYLIDNDLHICGSSIEYFGINVYPRKWIVETDEHKILAMLTLGNPFAHSTAFMKKEIFNNIKYKNTFPAAEDYLLWTDLFLAGFKFGNCHEVLLKYRLHNNQISSNNRIQIHSKNNIQKIFILELYYNRFNNINKFNILLFFKYILCKKNINILFSLKYIYKFIINKWV
jgi:glycosyltransferase involved in cell wall biosynthesis